MESQYQDDIALGWLEFMLGLPSGFEMQMQEGNEDQGHSQQGHDMMASDQFQSPLVQVPLYPVATDGFTDNFNVVHDYSLPDPGFLPSGLDNYSMELSNLEPISPGVSTIPDLTLSSSSSSSDGYDASANSPRYLTNVLYGLPMTMLPTMTTQSLLVSPVMFDNNIPMTSNISMAPQILSEQQPYEQPSDVAPSASAQPPVGMILPPETPFSPQPGKHRPRKKKKASRPTISAREMRKKERPEICPECGKGFPYEADLDKHIKARHKLEAPKYGLSTERFPCNLCPPSAAKSFARLDHLQRHERRKHGKSTSGRASRSPQLQSRGAVNGGGSPALEAGRMALKKLCPRGS